MEALYDQEKRTIEGELLYSKEERDREKMLHEMFESKQLIIEEKRDALHVAKEIRLRQDIAEFQERRQLQVQESIVCVITNLFLVLYESKCFVLPLVLRRTKKLKQSE